MNKQITTTPTTKTHTQTIKKPNQIKKTQLILYANLAKSHLHIVDFVVLYNFVQDSDTAVLSAKFLNDSTTAMDVMGERDFTRFGFAMSLYFIVMPTPFQNIVKQAAGTWCNNTVSYCTPKRHLWHHIY